MEIARNNVNTKIKKMYTEKYHRLIYDGMDEHEYQHFLDMLDEEHNMSDEVANFITDNDPVNIKFIRDFVYEEALWYIHDTEAVNQYYEYFIEDDFTINEYNYEYYKTLDINVKDKPCEVQLEILEKKNDYKSELY